MARDSDDEYIEDAPDDAYDDDDVEDEDDLGNGDDAPGRSSAYIAGNSNNRSRNTRSGPSSSTAKRKSRNKDLPKATWEGVQRSWEAISSDEEGNISRAALLSERRQLARRRRILKDTTPLQRGIIRHMMLVLDMSFAMLEKDMLPTRYALMMRVVEEFVREFFKQNPISQLGIVGMRDGIAVRLSEMSGNPADHVDQLRSWAGNGGKEPEGNPSLQNALEMCRGALFHAPSHGTREVLVIYGALLSSDPGDIHDTMRNLISDRIRVSIIGLAAQVAICAEICAKTNGGTEEGFYSVALDEDHFRELVLGVTTPRATKQTEKSTASLLMMGFPSRTKTTKPATIANGTSNGTNQDSPAEDGPLATRSGISLCACHNKPHREGYLCTRCDTKVCRLPIECPACGLTLILSTHLARSYHHLFPLRNWAEVSWAEAAASPAEACYACLVPFPKPPARLKLTIKGKNPTTDPGEADGGMAPAVAPTVAAEKHKGISESERYACPVCGNHFCIDCDVFAHEEVHNCPGCQSDTRGAMQMQMEVEEVGAV